MAVMADGGDVAGGGSAAGGRVPPGSATGRSLFTLTLCWRSTLAVLFFQTVVAGGGGATGGGVGDLPFSFYSPFPPASVLHQFCRRTHGKGTK